MEWKLPKREVTILVPEYICRVNIQVTTLKGKTELEMNPYSHMSRFEFWSHNNQPNYTLLKLMNKVMNDNVASVGLAIPQTLSANRPHKIAVTASNYGMNSYNSSLTHHQSPQLPYPPPHNLPYRPTPINHFNCNQSYSHRQCSPYPYNPRPIRVTNPTIQGSELPSVSSNMIPNVKAHGLLNTDYQTPLTNSYETGMNIVHNFRPRQTQVTRENMNLINEPIYPSPATTQRPYLPPTSTIEK